jgi:hypothetical protein
MLLIPLAVAIAVVCVMAGLQMWSISTAATVWKLPQKLFGVGIAGDRTRAVAGVWIASLAP